ncbi:mannosyltransferase (PIG-M) domain-containing protein [Ditylenchus destructor]|nr:mannosyltransferase (PIG-M) domain-containing protein [Ditylenchus destructor]
MEKTQAWTFTRVLWISFSVRLLLVFYAKIHDHLFRVNFTDIDYRVFSDAAELVSNGRSPYDRPTYRYTPLIAWLLIPNVAFPDFGKILFCAVDVATGWLLYKIKENDSRQGTGEGEQKWLGICVFWLFNPLICIISARGNADSIVCAAVLLSLYLLNSHKLIPSAIVHGALAVHLKVYPIIYLPSIFLHFVNIDDIQLNFRGLMSFIGRCLCNKRGLIFVMVSILFFINTLAIGYLLYEAKFLDEFLFYHIGRKDIRHNFSPYFYPLYLAKDDASLTKFISLGAFLPQVLCILAFSLKYRKDLPFCWFLTTFSFVSLNKVCTSQYFIWYLCFLPLIYDRILISTRKAILLTVIWFVAQGLWLLPAYLFEFQGWNSLLWIWAASLLFLATNCYIMGVLIQNYRAASPTVQSNETESKKIK